MRLKHVEISHLIWMVYYHSHESFTFSRHENRPIAVLIIFDKGSLSYFLQFLCSICRRHTLNCHKLLLLERVCFASRYLMLCYELYLSFSCCGLILRSTECGVQKEIKLLQMLKAETLLMLRNAIYSLTAFQLTSYHVSRCFPATPLRKTT